MTPSAARITFSILATWVIISAAMLLWQFEILKNQEATIVTIILVILATNFLKMSYSYYRDEWDLQKMKVVAKTKITEAYRLFNNL